MGELSDIEALDVISNLMMFHAFLAIIQAFLPINHDLAVLSNELLARFNKRLLISTKWVPLASC